MQKDFDGWNQLKQRLDKITTPPFFNEREIWWCSIGVNVGYEVYGKGTLFTRPVLIIKKHSASTFLGIPMSTKLKDRHDYYPLTFNGKNVSLMLGEMRNFDSRRLADKMGKLGENKCKEVREALFKNFQPR